MDRVTSLPRGGRTPGGSGSSVRPAEPGGGMHFYLRAFRYFRSDWRLVLALVMLIWLALGLGALAPAAIAVLTDSVLTGKPPSNLLTRALLAAVPASKVAQILCVAFAWLVLQIANETVTLLREMINNQLRYNGTGRVRADLFDHLQRLSPAYHKARPQGDAIYRLGIDTQGFFGVLDTFIGAANSLLTVFFVALVMFRWNARITIAALCLTPLLLAANVWFGRTIRRTSLASKQADSELTTFVQRAMSCIGLVQLFGRQPIESSRYRASVAHTISAGMKMSWQQQLYPWAQRVINAMGYAIVLGYGGYLVYRGQMTGAANAFTIGGMVAMSIYTGQLWEPLK